VNVETRRARPADCGRLCAITRAAIEAGGPAAYDDRQVQAWLGGVSPELFPVEDDDAHVRVAEADDPIGVGWLTTDPGDHLKAAVDGEITGIYVDPEAIGSGIGTTLYRELEEIAGREGLDALGLWASNNAVGFYDRLGFERVTDRMLTLDGTDVPVTEMRKRLD
jgi:putative acetyltransferase